MKQSLYATRVGARLLPGLVLLVVTGVLLLPVIRADADEPADTPQSTSGPAASSHQAYEVYPSKVTLTTRDDKQSVVLRARRADGVTIDLTRQAKLRVADPSIASIKGNVLTPGSDGQTELIVEHKGQTTRVPVVVERAGEDRPVSFRLDVLPVFAKSSCNNGACHGSARGQDGFNLSLFGFDPAGDYQRILYEQPGRRVNLADPERSLLLTKSINSVPHTGGKLFEKDSAFYKTVHDWLAAGARMTPKTSQPSLAWKSSRRISSSKGPARPSRSPSVLTIRTAPIAMSPSSPC